MGGIDIGDRAPEFALPGIRIVDGEVQHSTYALSAQRGRPTVLAFYPLDSSKVCTEQLCSYQDQLRGFEDLGADVWGISIQGVESHEEFAREQGLTFPLLADRPGGVGSDFGVMLGRLAARRSVFIIDGDGIVRWKHVALVGFTYRSAQEIREQLMRLFPEPAGSGYALPAPV